MVQIASGQAKRLLEDVLAFNVVGDHHLLNAYSLRSYRVLFYEDATRCGRAGRCMRQTKANIFPNIFRPYFQIFDFGAQRPTRRVSVKKPLDFELKLFT